MAKKRPQTTQSIAKKEENISNVQTSFNLDERKIFAIAFLIIALAVAYHFVIYIPQKDNAERMTQEKIQSDKDAAQAQIKANEAAAQKQIQEEQAAQKNQQKTDLQNCLQQSDKDGQSFWASTCSAFEITTNEDYKNCIAGRESDYNQCLANGLSQTYCSATWRDNEESYCKSRYSFTKDSSGSCLLPKDKSQRVDDSIKAAKDECYKLFPQN